MKQKLLDNHIFAAIAISIVITITMVLLRVTPLFHISHFLSWANHSVTMMLVAGFSEDAPRDDIVIVAIDEKTLNASGWLGRWQDFRRSYYAQVIDTLKKNGASVVGIDLLFSEPSLRDNGQDDSILAKSISWAQNVILGYTREALPLSFLTLGSAWIGSVHPYEDYYTSANVGFIPQETMSGKTYESFSLAVTRKYLDNKINTDTPFSGRYGTGYYRFHKDIYSILPLAYTDSNVILSQFISRYSDFTTLSFLDVYNGIIPKGAVDGKIVLLGFSATTFDERLTPVWVMPWVYVHANFIQTILDKSMIRVIDPRIEWIFLVAFIFLLSFVSFFLRNRIAEAGFIFAAFFMTYVSVVAIFTFFHLTFNYFIEVFFSIILTGILTSLYKYLIEEKGKRILKGALSQYLAEELVTSVLENYEALELWWARKNITVFFSDIEWFTTLSESLPASELMQFLWMYLEKTSDCILDTNGFINKYEWDAIMALWGALLPDEKQYENACEAALRQQESIRNLNPEIKKLFWFEISVRMGIHTGDAIVWNIGRAWKKIEYTAIGDTVNTASRLEWINKVYGTKICVSEQIALGLHDSDFIFRKLDKVRVKWKLQTTFLYELVGRKPDISHQEKERINLFETALAYYIDGDFQRAKEQFLEAKEGGDSVAHIFLDRIETYEWIPPDNWDGAYTAQAK